MAHYKKRKRRKGGTKGCCGMCMCAKYHALHKRILTRSEKRANLRHREQLHELRQKCL